MSGRAAFLSASVWKAAACLAATTLLLVALAYQVPTTTRIDLGRGIQSSLATSGFHDAEEGYRWTRGLSVLHFLDPPSGRPARLEVLLAGFRPPGSDPPRLVMEAAGGGLRVTPARRAAWLTMEVTPRGWWSSSLDVTLRSDTFSPGDYDQRALGVRVHEAKLVTRGGWPPFRQLLAAAGIVLLSVLVAGRLSTVFAWKTGAFVGGVVVAGYAWARLVAVYVVPLAAVAIVAVLLFERLLPRLARCASETVVGTWNTLRDGIVSLGPRPLSALGVLTVLGAIVGTWSAPRVDVDLGSGRERFLAERFAPADRAGDITFRRALPGANLNLEDLGGGGAPWVFEIEASSLDTPARRVLARFGEQELTASVDATWQTYRMEVPAPAWGGSEDRHLEFPIRPATDLRVARVVVTRGRSMPPLGVVVRYVAAGLLFCIALASTGLPRVWVWIGNATWLLLLVAAISGAPEMLPAFSQTLLGAALGAAILAAFSRSFVSMLGRRRLAPSISPVVLAAATIGFAAWFLTTASPLYEGGHFAYHTSISEEIWQGEFLLYYLPYPGSMLSRQPQWANLIVPHSCLFHTLASPLAAFPQAWFYPFTKAFLASLLFGIAVVCGLVATELGGKQAGSWAAAAAVASPTGFQLLGLGHLMTLFGCWAAALALGFILLHLPRLTERGIWWSAVGLVTWCNLSYTGSLLFASMTLAAASVLLIRVDPRLARRLALLLVAGWGAALILYYGHWVVPFLRETLPALAGGSGSDATIDIGARLAAFPAKLSYTFGSPILPVLGLAGVALVPRRPERLLLACWACVLVFVGAFDVVFNFLLKHHYYVFPALCIGLGLCLSSLQKKGRWGGWIAIAFFVYVGVTGIHEAMRTLTAP